MHPKYTWSRNGCRFSKINQFHEFPPHSAEILLSSRHFLSHPRIPIRKDLVCDERMGIPNSVLLPILVQEELFQTVFPTIICQRGDHTDFVQEEPGQQYYPQNNTVCIHMCDECMISIDSGVCHRLWSIL